MKSIKLRLHPVLITIWCTVMSLMLIPSSAQAFSSYLSNWQTTYPDSLSDDHAAGTGMACSLCHVPGNFSQFNAYGWSLRMNGVNFAAVEALNSDGDPTGATNLEEIHAGTQPGWTTGPNNVINGGAVTSTALPPSGIAGSLDPQPVNQPPIADPGGPYNGTEGSALGFDGTASSDADGSIVSYEWDFGDGNLGYGVTPSHTYIGTGLFTVTLTVTDDVGATASALTTATIAAGNQPPLAVHGGPYTGTAGSPVPFDGNASSDPDGSIVSYVWDFGDGSTANGVKVSHTYAAQGVYNVSLTVTDDSGAVDSANTTATIDAANLPPVANPSGPYQGTVNEPLAFDGTGSTDPDGSIISYNWDYGDGSAGNGAASSHTYSAEGTYNVTLSVTDDGGLVSAATTTATIGAVVNLPPVANANGPYSGTVGSPVTFDSTGSNDPDGTIVRYTWDFGDGSTATGGAPNHTYSLQGVYTVSLTVTDDNGAMDSSSTTATIGVGNQAPVANANGSYNGTVGIPVAFDSAGSADPDGTIVSYQWDFGDGTSAAEANPSHTYAVSGSYNVILTVTDDNGAVDSGSTTASISPVVTGADVYLSELWAPESIHLKKAKRRVAELVAIGGATSIRQGATVTLDASYSSGISVEISSRTVNEGLETDGEQEQFEFMVKVTCMSAGVYSIDWSASIHADQNSDLSNDTVTTVTTVHCTDRRKDDGDDEEHDDDEEDDDEEEHED